MALRSLVGLSAGIVGSSLYYARKTPTSEVECAQQPVSGPLSPTEFRPFPAIHSYDETGDTKVIRFALPEADMEMGMTVASCVVLRFTDSEGKEIIRPYTPITPVDQQGFFEILIKRYPNSKMGTHLHNLKKNQTVDVKGPFEKIKVNTNQWKHIGLIAGGTGISPCYQVARKVLRDPKDKTDVSLICAFRKKEDVLLGNEVNELMERHPRFAPYFVLSDPPKTWMGGIGHVNKEMIKAFMPAPSSGTDSIIMVSGPPGMMKAICGDKDFSKSPPTQGELTGILKDMGYTSKQVFKF